MFLSIIIPIYNDEKFLNECLDSCLDQDLSKDEYEIICVDDGSTDRTPEILREYAERYPNIRIITKQHGPQFGGGRMIGFQHAHGDFIWFVDHDDIIAPHAIDELKSTVEDNPEYDRYTFPYYRFTKTLTDEERAQMRAGSLRSMTGLLGKTDYVWNSIFRLAFLKENHITPWSAQIAEAGAFWALPQPFIIFGGDAAFMNECTEKGIRSLQITRKPLYFYRLHSGQMISNADPEAVRTREERRRNKVLYFGHRAWVQKQRYLTLRTQDPFDAIEALSSAIERLRDLVIYSTCFLGKQEWNYVQKRFREKDILFKCKPKDYPFSLRARLKQLSRKERRNPKTLLGVIVYYYSFTYLGARLLYQLERKKRRREEERIQNLSAQKNTD